MPKRENFKSFKEYYDAFQKEGSKYMFGGEVTGGHSPTFYGTAVTRLTQNPDGKWRIGQGAIFPEFEKEPILLDRTEFTKKMEALGVPSQTLEEFFNFKPDFDNF